MRFLNELYNISSSGKPYTAQDIIIFSTFLGGETISGNQLLIRKCYVEMKQLIADHFHVDPETLKDTQDTKKKSQVILTGTPGIGKSCFAYFLLLKLLRSDVQVVYQTGQRFQYFDGRGWSIIKTNSVSDFLNEFQGWYICDLFTGQGNVEQTDAKTVIIASTATDRFKDFDKIGARRFYLPLWSKNEISIFIKMQAGCIDVKEARKVIHAWGNVPRNIILRPSTTIDDLLESIDSLNKLKEQISQCISVDLRLPSKLIHLVPCTNYTTFIARICSYTAEKKLYKKLAEQDWRGLLKFAFSASGIFGGAAGQAFEHVAHEILKRGGKYIWQRLPSDGDSRKEVGTIHLNTSQGYFEFPSKLSAIEEWKIPQHTYCKSIARNFPCMDALLLSNSELYMFQMARAKKHPIKLGRLNALLTALRARNRIEVTRLIFVIPEGYQEMKTWQRVQTLKYGGVKLSRKMKQKVGNLTQHVLVLSQEGNLDVLDGAKVFSLTRR